MTIEETLLLVTTLGGVPEVEVLLAGSCKALGSLACVEREIKNPVGVAVIAHHLLCVGCLEDVDLVLVTVIDTTNAIPVSRDRTCNDTLAAFWKLEALDLFSGASIPEEHDRGVVDLTSESSRAISTDGDAHDVVGVLLVVSSMGLVSGLSGLGTEEALSVGILIKYDTEASCNIHCLVFAVVVKVLARIRRSVTVGVLEFVFYVRFRRVMILVEVGFCDLSEPRPASTKLLSGFVLRLEERVFFHLLAALSAVDHFATLLVVRTSSGIGFINESLVVAVVFGAAATAGACCSSSV